MRRCRMSGRAQRDTITKKATHGKSCICVRWFPTSEAEHASSLTSHHEACMRDAHFSLITFPRSHSISLSTTDILNEAVRPKQTPTKHRRTQTHCYIPKSGLRGSSSQAASTAETRATELALQASMATGATCSESPRQALVIKQKWAARIFDSNKTWELRGSMCHKRGKIAIAVSKISYLAGEVTLVDSFPVGRKRHGQWVPASIHEID